MIKVETRKAVWGKSSLTSPEALENCIAHYDFLPFFSNKVKGWSIEEMTPHSLWFTETPGPWEWKGPVARQGSFLYGKFFNKKAGFISMDWWPDFCNYRRSKRPRPGDESIEGAILGTLQLSGSLITRDLRTACGFNGKGMRSKFDGYLTRLQMGTYIVTEDFVYPRDRHNREYGWGWSLLNTPEALCGKEACQCGRAPEESLQRMMQHLRQVLPQASDKQLMRLIG